MKRLEINIFLGCYASYNEGHLLDQSYFIEDKQDLDESIEKFRKHIDSTMSKIHGETVPEYYSEEIYIADIEVTVKDDYKVKWIETDIGECLGELRTFLDKVKSIDLDQLELLIALAKDRHCPISDINLDDLFIIEVDSPSDSDLSYAYTDLVCFFEDCTNDQLVNYFDHESFGRDLRHDFAIIETSNAYYAVSNN